ncbi:MAG: hypothetical protein AB1452_15315 [Pseudomonadota bacterium]
MLRGLLFALFAVLAGAAEAQLRSIPAEAKRGVIRHIEAMDLEIDGRRQRLSPGAQIRDARNMVVLPAALPPGVLAKFVLDAQGMVARVWLLSPEEAAQPDPRR